MPIAPHTAPPRNTPGEEADACRDAARSTRAYPTDFCHPVHGQPATWTTGQKGLTQRTLQCQGIWELLPRPLTEAKRRDAWSALQPTGTG